MHSRIVKSAEQKLQKGAKSCPSCGAKLKKGWPILIAILAFFVLAAIIGSSGDDDGTSISKYTIILIYYNNII